MNLPVLQSGGPAPEAAEGMDAQARPWLGPHGEVMQRLELHITYTCPERCIFCSEEHRMRQFKPYGVSWARVATVLRTHAARGVKALHLTGGEPTIHPRFVEILMLAHKLGMRTSVGTIGTMLSDMKFAERAVPHLDEALFSLHGPTAAINDALTRRDGSFEQTSRALRNCLAVNPDFRGYVNTVVTRHNIDALPDTVAYAQSLGAQLIIVSNATPEGLALDDYETLAVPLEKLAEVLPRAARVADTAILRFFGVPMCLLGEYRALSNDLHWDARVTVEWARHPDKVALDDFYNWAPDRKRVHTPRCEGCSHRNVCMGVFDRYAELYSTAALQPYVEGQP